MLGERAKLRLVVLQFGLAKAGVCDILPTGAAGVESDAAKDWSDNGDSKRHAPKRSIP
jgi:hypothetical protein